MTQPLPFYHGSHLPPPDLGLLLSGTVFGIGALNIAMQCLVLLAFSLGMCVCVSVCVWCVSVCVWCVCVCMHVCVCACVCVCVCTGLQGAGSTADAETRVQARRAAQSCEHLMQPPTVQVIHWYKQYYILITVANP